MSRWAMEPSRSAPVPDEEDDSDVEYSFEGRNLKPHRLDQYGRPLPANARKEESSAQDAMETEAAPTVTPALAPIQVKVTPYNPKKNVKKMRQRSWEALESARRTVEAETGQLTRLIVEPTTGLLLPRDQVVGADEALQSYTERVHYSRSMEIVEELRAERMMRFFQGN